MLHLPNKTRSKLCMTNVDPLRDLCTATLLATETEGKDNKKRNVKIYWAGLY